MNNPTKPYRKVYCIKNYDLLIKKGTSYILRAQFDSLYPSKDLYCIYSISKTHKRELGKLLGRISLKSIDKYFINELEYKLDILIKDIM